MGGPPLGLAVLGSTGSVGRQTLDVARSLPGRFRVVALAAGQNVTLLEEQAHEFRPRLIWCDRDGDGLLARLRGQGYHWATPEEMAAQPDVDLVMVATAGKAGLAPTLAAVRAGKAVAIVNKEVLVMAGHIVTAEASRYGAQLRPVDSEHSAIWQCLWGENPEWVERIVLTASGGPFRDTPYEELAHVSAEEALRHPNWQMGRKITVDSVLHRESIVHSLVEFRDGSVKAQLGLPDMRLPIQCALTYPERPLGASLARLDLKRAGPLTFGEIDMRRFPCLGLALEAGRRGGTYPAALAAADEVAVQHFLAGHIGFLDIPRLIEEALNRHQGISDPGLEEVLAADAWARTWAEDWVKAKT